MKLALLTVFLGAVAVSAKDSAVAPVLRGTTTETETETVYAPPKPAEGQDLKALWDELAAEAKLMQVQIAEGRTTGECIMDCETSDVNKARCRRDCEEIWDKGNNDLPGEGNRGIMSCNDCRATFNQGSRKEERCLEACQDFDDGFDGNRGFGGDCETRCARNGDVAGCVRRCDGGFDDGYGYDGDRGFDGDRGYGNDGCISACVSSGDRARCERRCVEKKDKKFAKKKDEKLAKKKKEELAKKVYLQ